MHSNCNAVGLQHCLPVYYENLVKNPKIEIEKVLNFLAIPWSDRVLNHEKYLRNRLYKKEFYKPINTNSLSKWIGNLPEAVLSKLKTISPMLIKLGYNFTS